MDSKVVMTVLNHCFRGQNSKEYLDPCIGKPNLKDPSYQPKPPKKKKRKRK